MVTTIHPSLPIPKLEARGADAVVTRSGVVHDGSLEGMRFRPGDRLVLGPEAPGCLLLLTARGYGQPMIGRRMGGRLVAEPSGAPASPDRWQVAGAVVAVERELERGGPGEGSWCVVAETAPVSPGVEVLAPSAFEGIGLSGGDVETRCIQAAVAPRKHTTDVALAAASTWSEARALLPGTPFGRIRYAMRALGGEPLRQAVGARVDADASPRGIVVPFVVEPPRRQLALFG